MVDRSLVKKIRLPRSTVPYVTKLPILLHRADKRVVINSVTYLFDVLLIDPTRSFCTALAVVGLGAVQSYHHLILQ